jgi:hypothetical protein
MAESGRLLSSVQLAEREFVEEDTPSRREGLSKEKEDACRLRYCDLIASAGDQLGMCALHSSSVSFLPLPLLFSSALRPPRPGSRREILLAKYLRARSPPFILPLSHMRTACAAAEPTPPPSHLQAQVDPGRGDALHSQILRALPACVAS